MESLESLQSSVTNPLIPALGQELLSNTDPTNSLLGFSTGSTQSVSLIDPIVEPGLLPVELTATNFTATNFNVMDSLTLQESQSSSSSIDPLLGNSLGVNVNSAFDSGVFTVGATGKVSFDFLLDGGVYQGELAIFSLEGMDEFELGSEAFIQEASRRALSDSDAGHVVISDLTEGARFHG